MYRETQVALTISTDASIDAIAPKELKTLAEGLNKAIEAGFQLEKVRTDREGYYIFLLTKVEENVILPEQKS